MSGDSNKTTIRQSHSAISVRAICDNTVINWDKSVKTANLLWSTLSTYQHRCCRAAISLQSCIYLTTQPADNQSGSLLQTDTAARAADSQININMLAIWLCLQMKQQSLANLYVWQWLQSVRARTPPQLLGDRLPAARWLAVKCAGVTQSVSVQSADCCNYLQPNVKNINAITGHLPGVLLHVTCEERLLRMMCSWFCHHRVKPAALWDTKSLFLK